MGEIQRLKTEIQSRKFRSMEIAAEIDVKVREIKKLLASYPLIKLRDLELHLIDQLASEAHALKKQYTALQKEIELAEKELES